MGWGSLCPALPSPEHWGLQPCSAFGCWTKGSSWAVDLTPAITLQLVFGLPLCPSHSHRSSLPQPCLEQLGTNEQLWEKGAGSQMCLPLLCGLSDQEDLQDGRCMETSALSLLQRISWLFSAPEHPGDTHIQLTSLKPEFPYS